MNKILYCNSINFYKVPKYFKNKIIRYNFVKTTKNFHERKIVGIILNPFTKIKKKFFKKINKFKIFICFGIT